MAETGDRSQGTVAGNDSGPVKDLRRQAEELAHGRTGPLPEDIDGMPREQLHALFHELRVHQIELEMQNEELLRMEEIELTHAKERYFDLYDLAPVGYLTISESGLILESNLTAAALLAIPRSKLAKQPFSRFIFREDQDIYYHHRKQLFETKTAQECDLRIVMADGTFFWGHLTGTLAQETGGTSVCRVVMSDITIRVLAETEVRTLNAELEQRVTARTLQLESSNKELEAFAYSVSHDLRTPLRAINGFASMLQDDLGPSLDAEGLRLLCTIRHNTNKMDHLINDLLLLARVSSSTLNWTQVEMKPLVLEIIDEASSPETASKIAFHVADLPNVFGDPTLIRQLWVNLISNAIKFTSPKPDGLIGITGSETDAMCQYTIRDNGVGFDPLYADKLFGTFQQLHKSGDFEGSGVGLAIVQRIVHRHGGEVWGVGQVDVGAAFTFTILKDYANQS